MYNKIVYNDHKLRHFETSINSSITRVMLALEYLFFSEKKGPLPVTVSNKLMLQINKYF